MGMLSTAHLCVVAFFLANVYLMVVFQHRSSPNLTSIDLSQGHVSTRLRDDFRGNGLYGKEGEARRMVPAVLSFRNRQGFQSGVQQTFSGGHTCSKNASDNGTLYLTYSLHPADLCSGKFSDTDRPYSNDVNNSLSNRVTRILVQVHSRCSSRQRRAVIRDTWGRVARHPDSSVALVFLLARPPITSSWPANDVTAAAYDSNSAECDMDTLRREFSLYGDTMIGDFSDTYHSVTFKSLMGMSWASKFCTQATHLLKLDDDVYFNITNLLHALQFTPTSDLDSSVGFISGALNTKSTVARRGLWGLPQSQYSQSTWPPYCAGCAYVMTVDTARRLMTASEHTCHLPLEDVYVTGVLARAAGFRCTPDARFPQWYTGWNPSNAAMVMRGHLYGLHGVTEEQTVDLYRRVKTQRCANCTDKNRLYMSFT